MLSTKILTTGLLLLMGAQANNEEVALLQERISVLEKENNALKQENENLKQETEESKKEFEEILTMASNLKQFSEAYYAKFERKNSIGNTKEGRDVVGCDESFFIFDDESSTEKEKIKEGWPNGLDEVDSKKTESAHN